MKKVFLTLILASALLIIPGTSVFAVSNINQGDSILLPKDEIVSEDYFAFGEKVTISGTIERDAYIAGGNVFIEGDINGDLLVAGGTINILGNVSQDIRVAGGQVIISGNVGRNVTSLGGTITYTDSASVNGSIVNASGTLGLFAPVNQGAAIASGDATLGNRVGGNIIAGVENLTLNPGAEIGGNLNYWSSREVEIQQGAQVQGQLTRNETKRPETPKANEALGAISTGFRIISFFSALVIGLLIIKFVPEFTKKTANTVIKKPFKSAGIGLLTIIITPIISILLLITVVGLPLGIIALIIYGVTIYIAKIIVSLAIGTIVFRSQKQNTYLLFVIGLLIYSLFRIVPILGFITALLTVFLGTGALVNTKLNTYKILKEKKLI